MKWQDLDGLHAPDSIKALSRGYIKAQDPISEFIDDTFEIGSGMETPALVYREYQKWCEKNGERGMSRRKLLEKMEGHSGINFKMTSMGKMVDGLNLRLQ
jgi:phage/plasmid-associated DNA primase